VAGVAHADDVGPIATDRPGNGNASSTVPKHRLQIETSASYLRSDAGAVTVQQITLPTLVRFGLLDSVEVRVGSSIVGIDATSGSDEGPALTDTLVGAKVQLAENAGTKPQLAVMVDVTLPTGDGGFTGDKVVPEARVAAAWSLPSNFGFLINAGGDLPEAAGDRFVRLLYVANLGYTPASLLDGRLSVFVESFGRLSLDSDQAHVVQVDLGAAYSLNPNLQLDFFTQHGLSDGAPDFQIAVGVSARL